MVPRGSSPDCKSPLDFVDPSCVQSEQSTYVTIRSEPTWVQFFVYITHLRLLRCVRFPPWSSRRAEGLRLLCIHGEALAALTVWTSCLLADLKSVSVIPHSTFLSPNPPFPSPAPSSAAPASTLQLPSCFILFSSPPPQRWLQLSSTGSNRHQITINPASLDLPIVILLGG